MHFATISGAAVLLASAPFALAVGSATLVNGCGFDIYYAPTSGTFDAMVALSPGGSYTAGYADEGQGTSIKVAPSDDISGPITQFEYTWADGKINYDISNINGNPFASNGMVLTPSMSGDSNNPTCVPVDCPAGESTCSAAYNQPDDTRTMVCSEDSSLVMTICVGGSSSSSSSSSPSSSNPGSNSTTPIKAREADHSEPQILHSHHHRAHVRHFPRK